MNLNKNSFLLNDISSLKGVGSKTKKYLEKKRIEKIKDLLWDLPHSIVDRSKITELSELEIGKIATIKVIVKKYNFPRIRNLPNKVICEDKGNKINIVFFNSYEGYIKKILPIENEVIISGKINFFNKKYQITNPIFVKPISQKDEIAKIFPKYSLTEGLKERNYRKLIIKVLNDMEEDFEWHSNYFLKKNKFNKFKKTFINLHNPIKKIDIFSNDYKRIAYDEIFANLLALYKARKSIKIIKKKKKIYSNRISKIVLKNFPFDLTKDQKKVLKDLDQDLRSNNRMFRLLQGDVGSGKTVLAFVAAANVIESNYQAVLMAPTEILSMQHYELANQLFSTSNIKIEILTSKTPNKDKKQIMFDLKSGNIDFLIGTHSLFQKKNKI